MARSLDPAGAGAGPHLLAPCDLQAIKACGVAFAGSMVERVIEERAKGDPARAALLRTQLADMIGSRLGELRPGLAEAVRAKQALIAEGLWSRYLEVGIGPDADVFTKAPALSAVGAGGARADANAAGEPEEYKN